MKEGDKPHTATRSSRDTVRCSIALRVLLAWLRSHY
nr:MAG TPA: hypothetical protein [Caudoviricetes sp.]